MVISDPGNIFTSYLAHGDKPQIVSHSRHTWSVLRSLLLSRRRELLPSDLGAEFEAVQLAAEARALGAELYQQAAAISPETVEAVASVLAATENQSRARLPRELAAEYARQMMADSALRHRHRTTNR